MTAQDFFITPIYIILFSLIAYFIRPYVTTPQNRKYFLPAIALKFAGAIALGMIYQFYYDSGDTYAYFLYGSKWIWEAMIQDPVAGFSIFLEPGGARLPETFEFTQHIWYYRDPQSFMIVKIAAFFDIFTFHTYSATALWFSLFSFSGSWAFFMVLCKKYPYRTLRIAFAVLFIPSIIFWGSGILKDTITLGALLWISYAAFQIIENKKRTPQYFLILLLGGWLIYSIKVYILLIFIPMAFIWAFWSQILAIRNRVLRWTFAPVFAGFYMIVGFGALTQVTSDSERYRLDRIAESAAITSYDIRYGWGARTGGDGGYDLGTLDGSWGSMIRLFPQAVVVTLFRPFLWEVRNPLMLLSALEGSMSLFFMFLWIKNRGWRTISNNSFMVFCLGFALIFSFAVGVSTFNFGSLARYKIPMLPFFWLFVLNVVQPPKRRQMSQ